MPSRCFFPASLLRFHIPRGLASTLGLQFPRQDTCGLDCTAVDIIEPKSPVPDDPAPLGNFLALAGARDAGASHAEACAASLRDMNPFVESSGSKRELSSVAEDEISRYTIVVCVGQPMPVVRDLDAKCSRIGVKFIAASAPGPVGWYFLNLQRHDYVTETRTHDTEERVVKQVCGCFK